MRRFVLPITLEDSSTIKLTGDDHHYLSRVLRLTTGDTFPAVDASGVLATCTIRDIGSDVLVASVSYDDSGANLVAEPDITLYQSITKGRKLDRVVRDATECGVASIVLVRSRYSVGEIDESRAEKKIDRWRRIVREAMQQSGNPREPEIVGPINLSQVPDHWRGRGPAFVFHQERLDSKQFLDTLIHAPREVAICIGPEGGIDDNEVVLLVDAGFIPAYLGRRVLRSETASLYAIATVQTAQRLLGGDRE